MPTLSNAGTPVAVTSQPAVETNVGTLATIPAGLPTGINTIYHGGSNTSSSFFLVSVGSSTTVVVGSSTSSVSRSGATGGSGSGSEETGASGTSGQGASATQSGGASESSSAADAVKVASGAVLGLGAVFVALL